MAFAIDPEPHAPTRATRSRCLLHQPNDPEFGVAVKRKQCCFHSFPDAGEAEAGRGQGQPGLQLLPRSINARLKVRPFLFCRRSGSGMRARRAGAGAMWRRRSGGPENSGWSAASISQCPCLLFFVLCHLFYVSVLASLLFIVCPTL